MIFEHDEKEVVLEISYNREIRPTRDSPGEPASVDIIDAHYPDGEVLDDDLIYHIQDEHYNQIMDKIDDAIKMAENDPL